MQATKARTFENKNIQPPSLTCIDNTNLHRRNETAPKKVIRKISSPEKKVLRGNISLP
jgi:hypothetical protein